MAGISLNLIAGSNGIMERATKVADTYDEAKVKESLELSNAEMLIDCLGGGDLATDLYDYILQRCNQNADKTAQTSNGKYWIDTDGKFYYTDNDTNRTVELGKDTNGAPMIIGTGNSNGGGEEQEEIKKGVGTDVIKPESDYGTKVNYSANGINDWKIFLNDGTNIYLIASDYVPVSGLDCAEGITTSGHYVVTGNSRDGLVSWMTTNLYWSEYTRGYIGATATGGPTLEQFWASYNGKYGTQYSAEYQDLTNHEGYSNSLYFPHQDEWNNTRGYWLASNYSANGNLAELLSYDGRLAYGYYYDAHFCIRPLIKLPANTVMSWKGDAWDLVEKATERIAPENYGDKIQYSANGVDDWKVFLNDGKNVYLIASDWVAGTTLNAGTNIGINGNYVYVTDSNPNTLVNWMTNTENWQQFVGVEGATVTGGPTKEQYELSVEQSGGVKDVHLGNRCWLATTHPTLYLGVWASGNPIIGGYANHTANCGIRPLVKLPADARVVEQDGVWKIRGVATTEAQAALYGDKVNYSANGIEDWKLFLNDGTNVYLIASDYVPNSGLNCAEGIATNGNYSAYGNSRDGVISWLTTNSYWSQYSSGFSGSTATGGPTLAQFWASYNQKYGTEYSGEYQPLASHIGYNDLVYFPHKESWNGTNGIWLASPSSTYGDRIEYVFYNGNVYFSKNNDTTLGIRPLIKLPKNAGMTWNGSSWDLSS